MFPLLKYDERQVEDYCGKATREMVLESLANERPGWFDLLNLISPAAYDLMPQMREVARRNRIRYYGKTDQADAPLCNDNTSVKAQE